MFLNDGLFSLFFDGEADVLTPSSVDLNFYHFGVGVVISLI